MTKRFLGLSVLALAAVVIGWASPAHAGGRRAIASRWGYRHAQTRPWHGGYYYTQKGAPVALVVPPTAQSQMFWGWGVAQSGTRPIYHQFARPYPGESAGGADQLYPTPAWPSHTDQFGVYYVRGPWGATAPRAWRHRRP